VKKSRKGVSNVIYAVLMIGIVLVSFLFVYNIVNSSLKQKTTEAESGFDKILRIFGFGTGENESTINQQGIFIPLTGSIVLDSGESCYIELEINENKTKDIYNNQSEIIFQDIEFSLFNITNLFGSYFSLFNYYNEEIPSSYILRTYDKNNTILENFSLDSGRFIFYDDFGNITNPGGVIELNKSVISAVIPYDKRISKIKIENGNSSTDLNVNPADFKCERTCKIENESLTENERCCSRFVKAMQDDNSYRCVKCGDGICSPYENEYSCYKDCGRNFTCPAGYNKKEFGCEPKVPPVVPPVTPPVSQCNNNGICDNGESYPTCSNDCPAQCSNYDYGYGYGNEGGFCTTSSGGNGICSSGSCFNCTSNNQCSDSNDCTNDYCDTNSHTCQHTNNDGNSCDSGYGTCSSGSCNPSVSPPINPPVLGCTQNSDCNDWKECTNDYCDSSHTCQYDYLSPCYDTGVCETIPEANCNAADCHWDGSECVPTGVCSSYTNPSSCQLNGGGNTGCAWAMCDNGEGICGSGTCNYVGGGCTSNNQCSDSNDCTNDYCDTNSHTCYYDYSTSEGNQCDDGSGGLGTCSSGSCYGYGG